MKIYNYGSTGEYQGEDVAFKNPRRPDDFLIPANATTIEPPETEEGYVAVFKNGAWAVEEDHRGKAVWDKANKTQQIINDIGPIPEVMTEKAPSQYDVWDNQAMDWVADEDQVIKAEILSLESMITVRRIREAALGMQDSVDFLQDIEDQIEVLRGQL